MRAMTGPEIQEAYGRALDAHKAGDLDTAIRGYGAIIEAKAALAVDGTNVDAQIGFDNDKYGVTLYVTNLLDYDKPTSAQTYGDPFIGLPIAPPVLAYTTYPADPRQYGLRATIKF